MSRLAHVAASRPRTWLIPILTDSSDPAVIQRVLATLLTLRDTLDHVRAELAQERAPLALRFSAAAIQTDLDDAIAAIRTWLTRIARRGGRGVPYEVIARAGTSVTGADQPGHARTAPIAAIGARSGSDSGSVAATSANKNTARRSAPVVVSALRNSGSATGAGQSPARPTGPSMAQGCAALSAVGPALGLSQPSEQAVDGDRFSALPDVAEIAGDIGSMHTQPIEGANNDV